MNLIQAIRAVLQELQDGNDVPETPNRQVVTQLPLLPAAKETPVVANHMNELPPEVQKLPVLPQVPPHVLNEALEKNKDVVWKYLFRVVERAVKNDKSEVNLWRVDGTKLVLYLRRDQFSGCLERMVEYFIQTEQYEYAPFCYELLDTIKVNDIIRPSR